jgi:AcrR family transcriptional regulator
VLRNRSRILDAALAVAADRGWADMSLLAIAKGAGLSFRPVQARFPAKDDAASALWLERVNTPFQQALAELLDSAGLLGTSAERPRFASALHALAKPAPDLHAAIELLIVSLFEPGVNEAVQASLGSCVRDWVTPERGRTSKSLAARRAYALNVGVGMVMASRRPGIEDLDLEPRVDQLMRALASDRKPIALPKARLPFVGIRIPFDTGDPVHDALLQATIDLVSEVGFDAATTARIARRAEVSEGAIFMRYESKLGMFIDATARQQQFGWQANADFQHLLDEEYGTPLAEAIMIRELMRPEVGPERVLSAEQLRVSWHSPVLLRRLGEQFTSFVEQTRAQNPTWPQAVNHADAHLGYAAGLGVTLLPWLAPDCWSLPFDVATVALYAEP